RRHRLATVAKESRRRIKHLEHVVTAHLAGAEGDQPMRTEHEIVGGHRRNEAPRTQEQPLCIRVIDLQHATRGSWRGEGDHGVGHPDRVTELPESVHTPPLIGYTSTGPAPVWPRWDARAAMYESEMAT